jgi:hypothetical protein
MVDNRSDVFFFQRRAVGLCLIIAMQRYGQKSLLPGLYKNYAFHSCVLMICALMMFI